MRPCRQLPHAALELESVLDLGAAKTVDRLILPRLFLESEGADGSSPSLLAVIWSELMSARRSGHAGVPLLGRSDVWRWTSVERWARDTGGLSPE